MGRKRKKIVEFKPFCYYCDKEFDDVSSLQQHQKLRHFMCPVCSKKFSSAFSMSSHALQVHRENIIKVPNAKTGRDSLDITIYGMVNVPQELIQEKYKEKLMEVKRHKADVLIDVTMPPIPDRPIPLNMPPMAVAPSAVPFPIVAPSMVPSAPVPIPMFMPPMTQAGDLSAAPPAVPPPPKMAENKVPPPVPAASDITMIYTEDVSIEEKLAEMDKYRYIPLKAH
eukprot:TRINITY_DN3817_c0_g3_i4.p1 TRINITY_DN3817_c0_g3~~TRINITY_DN3817_c0_g3_i4.p1  ORF type:complete len:225 (+),score=65.92 TRINITY_DN3817_c0_g3_i4:139-813(+)